MGKFFYKKLNIDDFWNLIENFPDIFYIIDKEGKFLYVNKAIRILGYEPEELIGKPFSVIIPKDEFKKISRKYVLQKYRGKKTGDEKSPKLFDERRTNGRATKELEINILKKNGKIQSSAISIIGEVTSAGYYDKDVKEKDKRFLGSIGIIRDITLKKEREKELLEYQKIIESIDYLIIITDKEDKIIFANNQFIKFFQPDKDIIGLPLCKVLEFDFEEFSSDEEVSLVKKVKLKDKEFWFLIHKIPLKNEEEKIENFIYIIKDLTEAIFKNGLTRLRINYLEKIIEEITEALIFIDKEYNIVFINRVMLNVLNFKISDSLKIIGQNYKSVLIKNEKFLPILNNIENCFSKKKSIKIERFKIGDSIYYIEITPIFYGEDFLGILFLMRDITYLINIEDKLNVFQRVNAFSFLAGGIGHDFNNLLSAMMGNISILKEKFRDNNEIMKIINDIEVACNIGKELSSHLLNFGKYGIIKKEETDLKDIIKSTASFFLRGTNIYVELNLANDLWNCNMETINFQEVIQNIIVNAKEAIPIGGKLEIRAENLVLEEKNELNLKAGNYVKISISDTGIGISEENLENIFKPFWTTKKNGSGLGLARCLSIVESCNGKIEVESELGKGTTFHIYLPAIKVEKHRKEEAIKEKREEKLSKKLNILVMDDEEIVLNTVERMLKFLGCEVIKVKKGEEAIEVYKNLKKAGVGIDLAILDLSISGGMGGAETSKKLYEIDKDIKIIFSTGYTDKIFLDDYKKYGVVDIIGKPFALQDLREVLLKFGGES